MQETHRILLCAGTRPELIKLAPVYRNLRDRPAVTPFLCLTGQHDSLVQNLPRVLDVTPEFVLTREAGTSGQLGLLQNILRQLAILLEQLGPELVVVQGDTASALAGAMAACLQDIPVCHVEAGLRTRDLLSPFPEELYRQLISRMGTWHFCPTPENRATLLREDISSGQIFLSGNTSIDAVLDMLSRSPRPLETKAVSRPYILVTLHRREVQGEKLITIVRALRNFAESHAGYDFIVTLHPNPAIRRLLSHHLGGQGNIRLLPPLDYPDFVPLMKKAFAILSDSGGIQEEAPALDVPVIVLRDKTERQEGVASGCLRLAGYDPEKIFSELSLLIHDRDHYIDMCTAPAPFGEGRAGRIISARLEQIVTGQKIPHDDSSLSP
ncbi:non-hydrolyzing UDP-N-acetylglucosamine 2-epimerase [Emcibacter nanhaiensis]|uniref:UDP-N-acetylglucosamine 2-epimerase (non-hydrolyzing) n=1 Tax=Emcibacter nanhaiensis TaxID=1505037 RepID=A0A501PB40_9PROT|nr:UDP-N-acetylglucosamine 2-epimerase (non-hydrolyzing) [Emcibacter nanhaiensis]TPD57570.1 UDP-N-acetylglucosamine 2-epimerase (non-hydrolyzing) [Emcibacter nanhaiensis]